jgi:hypothetical protein
MAQHKLALRERNEDPRPGNYLFRFDSVEDFLEAVATERPGLIDDTASRGDWCADLSPKQAVELARRGDDSLVPQAECLLQQFEDLTLETPRREWQASCAGAYPVVPEYLAGSPQCMRMMRPITSHCGPVNIYFGITSSAALSKEELLKRGITVLALIAKLQAIRPVELHLVSLLDADRYDASDCITTMRIDSRPLDLAVAGFLLSNCGFDRILNHGLAEPFGFRGGWSATYKEGESALRKHLKLAEDDVYIPPAYYGDYLTKDPVKWINGVLTKIGGANADLD